MVGDTGGHGPSSATLARRAGAVNAGGLADVAAAAHAAARVAAHAAAHAAVDASFYIAPDPGA